MQNTFFYYIIPSYISPALKIFLFPINRFGNAVDNSLDGDWAKSVLLKEYCLLREGTFVSIGCALLINYILPMLLEKANSWYIEVLFMDVVLYIFDLLLLSSLLILDFFNFFIAQLLG